MRFCSTKSGKHIFKEHNVSKMALFDTTAHGKWRVVLLKYANSRKPAKFLRVRKLL